MSKISKFSADFVNLHLRIRIVYEVVMIQQIEIFEMSRQTGLRRKPSGIGEYAPWASCAPLVLRRASSESAASPINGDAQICKHTSSGLSINENAAHRGTDPL